MWKDGKDNSGKEWRADEIEDKSVKLQVYGEVKFCWSKLFFYFNYVIQYKQIKKHSIKFKNTKKKSEKKILLTNRNQQKNKKNKKNTE